MELVELVRRAKAGEEEAKSELYEITYKRVYYLALRLTNNPEDAEDATQDTFVSAFSALSNLKNDNAFEGWLFQIAANKCRSKLSRTKHTEELPEDFSEHTPDPNENLLPETVLQESEKRRMIVEIKQSLPDAQRECVMLFYYSGMSVRQIAETLGCSEGTVKSRLNYARQKIRDEILEIEERDGIRLHVFVPLGLLLAKDFDAATSGLAAAALGGAGAAGATAAAGGASGASAAASGAGGGAKAGFLATLKAKVVAGIAAAAVVAGGATVASQLPKQVVFSDPAMEHNIRILVDKPEGKLYQSDLKELYHVCIFDDGMALDDWESGRSAEEAWEGTVPVESLSDLKHLKNLNTIYYRAGDPRLLNSLGENDTLSTLMLIGGDDGPVEVEDFSFIDKLPKLERLLAYAAEGADLSPIERCESLRILDLASRGGISLNADGLGKLLSLEIFANQYGERPGVNCELILTRDLTELRSLSLHGGVTASLTPLYHMPKLNTLDIYSESWAGLNLAPLGGLKELRAVSLIGHYDETFDLSPLSDCPLLEVYSVLNGTILNPPQHALGVYDDYTLDIFNEVNFEVQQEVYRLLYGDIE